VGGTRRDRGTEDFEFVMGVVLIGIAVIVALVLLQDQLVSLFAGV